MDVKYTDEDGYEHTEVMSMQEYERRLQLPEEDKDSLAFLERGKALILDNKVMKLRRYAITFENWASPIFVNAYKLENATKRAYALFPVCDCGCGEATEIKEVRKLN